MTLLERLKLLRELRQLNFKGEGPELTATTFIYEGHIIFIGWDELIAELEMLEMYRAGFWKDKVENEEY